MRVKVVFYVTRLYATAGITRFRLINVAPIFCLGWVTKVCFLFDCCVLFSTFLTLLCPPYPAPMQHQRKLRAGGSRFSERTHRSFFRSMTAAVGVAMTAAADIGTVATAMVVVVAMIVAAVAVVVAVAMAVVAAVCCVEGRGHCLCDLVHMAHHKLNSEN